MNDNPWKTPEGDNPYVRTPYHIADIRKPLDGRKALRNHLKKRRVRIEGAPDQFFVADRPVTEADLNAAQDVLLDPKGAILAELRRFAVEAPSNTPGVAILLEELENLHVPEARLNDILDPARLIARLPQSNLSTVDFSWLEQNHGET